MSAILDFGGHLGFLPAKKSLFTKTAVVSLLIELELSKFHSIYLRSCTNGYTFQFFDWCPRKIFLVQNIMKRCDFLHIFVTICWIEAQYEELSDFSRIFLWLGKLLIYLGFNLKLIWGLYHDSEAHNLLLNEHTPLFANITITWE